MSGVKRLDVPPGCPKYDEGCHCEACYARLVAAYSNLALALVFGPEEE